MGDTENTAEAGDTNDQVTEFNAPATQEELNRIIQDRVARVKNQYADYDDVKARAEQAGTFESRIAELEATNGELTGKIQSFESEKERAEIISAVAKDKKVPAGALRGSTREELEAHADQLAELLKPSGPVIPGQELAPDKIPSSPNVAFARQLFGKD